MKILSKKITEEQFSKLIDDLDIARMHVYQKWGFNLKEIATLLDRPEEWCRDVMEEK